MPDNNNNLKILSRSLKVISKINRDLLSFSSEKKLCQTICNDLVRVKGYKFLWIGLKENGNGIFSPIALMGKDKGFIKSVEGSWDKYGFNGCPTSMALKRGKNFLNKDLKNVQRFVPWDKMTIKEGFLSALVLPIKYQSDVIGTFHVYSDTKNYFLKEERAFFKEVVGDIGLGLKSIKDDRNSIKRKIKYKELVKRISSCVAVYEATGNGNDFIFKDFNKAAEKTEKIKRKDVLEKSLLKVFPGVKDFGLFDVFKRVYKTGKSERHPISIYKDNRISGWRENYVYRLPDGNIVAVYNDLTKEKLEKEKLVNANERLTLAQKLAGAGMWDLDMNTKKLNCSPEFYILFGLGPKKEIATLDGWLMALHPEDRQMAEEKLNESIKERKQLFMEYRIIMPSGKIRWINVIGNTICDDHNKAVRMAGICIDITEKKKMQNNINESEFRYKELFDSAPVGIVVIGKTGTIISTNDTLDLMGLPRKKTIGKKFTDIGILKIKDIPLTKIFRGKQIKPFIISWNDSQGREIIGEVYASLVKQYGKVTGCQLIIRDITEQKKLEQETISISRFPSENPNPVIRADYDGRILYFNSACKDIVGWKQEVGSFVLKPILKEVLNSVKLGKASSRLQFGDQFYKGTFINIKEYKYINIYLRDITEKKKAEDGLKASYIKAKKTLEQIISTISHIIEIKDPYTSGHQKNVARIAVEIAKELDLSDEKIEALNIASLLHDTGKATIPASILSKPGKLSEIEFSIIKEHSKTGFDILKEIDFGQPVAKIVLQHHERIDGSGYPSGLKDKDICIEAKILAVADVVEAMSSHRPYRPALESGKAVEELKLNSGILYDKKVVDAYLSLTLDVEKIKLGQHLCAFYDNPINQFSYIIPYMVSGLKNNEKCFYILDENTQDNLKKAFDGAGFDISGYLKSKQLVFYTKAETYMNKGYFEPVKMINLLKETESLALKEGYKGIRVTGEMTWVFGSWENFEKLIEYENRLNEFFPDSKACAICQYNEKRFDQEVLTDIIATHPKIIINGLVYKNNYFLYPDKFNKDARDSLKQKDLEIIKNGITKKMLV